MNERKVSYTRYHVTTEVRFVNGLKCCEWCNMSFRNRKGHITCSLTGEEMASPGDSIGFNCPLRRKKSYKAKRFEHQQKADFK